MSYLDSFLFGIFPYIALAVFFAGSLLRFDRDQYTWKSDSSQMLRAGQLRWGSNLFHLGILGIFFGHLFGLLTPLAVWHALGVTPPAKQMLAMVAGGDRGRRDPRRLDPVDPSPPDRAADPPQQPPDGHGRAAAVPCPARCWGSSASACPRSTGTARR